jgi:DNA-binding response OmpR family regulator
VKILVIDSNKDLEVIYRRKLKTLSDEIDFTTCLKKATLYVSKRKYDLILLSHTLKKSDGIEAYNMLRLSGYSGPVIITASGREIQKLRPQYNGIKGLVNKCLNGKAFVEKIVEFSEESDDSHTNKHEEV